MIELDPEDNFGWYGKGYFFKKLKNYDEEMKWCNLNKKKNNNFY